MKFAAVVPINKDLMLWYSGSFRGSEWVGGVEWRF